jgi:hypothetical protein
VEAGLGLLPFSEQTITTPTAHRYVGVSFARKLCGVSIIRSGEWGGAGDWRSGRVANETHSLTHTLLATCVPPA